MEDLIELYKHEIWNFQRESFKSAKFLYRFGNSTELAILLVR
jgi:hypothetical protein